MSATNATTSMQQKSAIAVALVLLIGGGAAYRMATAFYTESNDSAPLPPGTLEAMPLQLGEWQGQDVAVNEWVIKATDTDGHINRGYLNTRTEDRVGFFVGYGIRFRDLMPHRPEVCYVGAGWTLEETLQRDLPAPDGTVLPCQVQRFTRGFAGTERIVVLNYYLLDGEYGRDVRLLRNHSRSWNEERRYVAQVQITSSETARGTGKAAVEDFGAMSAPVIRDLLNRAVFGDDAPGGAASRPAGQGVQP